MYSLPRPLSPAHAVALTRAEQVTKSMGSVVKGMDKVLGSMNVEAISKVRAGAWLRARSLRAVRVHGCPRGHACEGGGGGVVRLRSGRGLSM